MSTTPQLDRMREVQAESQAIGEFLEWLGEQRIDLCSIDESLNRWAPLMESAEKLLAHYFGVDLNAAERERRTILADFAKAQPGTTQGDAS